jgi:hypothetical protein
MGQARTEERDDRVTLREFRRRLRAASLRVGRASRVSGSAPRRTGSAPQHSGSASRLSIGASVPPRRAAGVRSSPSSCSSARRRRNGPVRARGAPREVPRGPLRGRRAARTAGMASLGTGGDALRTDSAPLRTASAPSRAGTAPSRTGSAPLRTGSAPAGPFVRRSSRDERVPLGKRSCWRGPWGAWAFSWVGGVWLEADGRQRRRAAKCASLRRIGRCLDCLALSRDCLALSRREKRGVSRLPRVAPSCLAGKFPSVGALPFGPARHDSVALPDATARKPLIESPA